jgi:nitroreductase
MFFSIIEKRRSIRKFQEKPIETETIDQLVEAALRSPSSRGFNPWEFVVVTDKATIEKLAQAKEHGSAFLKNAPLAFVVCADENRSDVWVEDASIASIFLHLAAASFGLGSCWIQIRKRPHDRTKSAEAYIQELLRIPSNLKVESIIAVGYPDEEKSPHKKADLQYGKVHYDAYGQKR